MCLIQYMMNKYPLCKYVNTMVVSRSLAPELKKAKTQNPHNFIHKKMKKLKQLSNCFKEDL